MAEARQATHEPQVRFKEDGTDLKCTEHTGKLATTFIQDLKGCVSRTQKQFYKGVWPTTWDNFLVVFLVVFLVMFTNQPMLNCISRYLWLFGDYLHLDDSYPYLFRIVVISFISSFLYFIVALYVREYFCLRALLSFKGWLYQAPRSSNPIIVLWGIIVRVVSSRKPKLYSYQSILPRMSVPPLKSTVTKLLESLKPLLDQDEFQKMELDAKKFLQTIGPRLQWVLYLKSWWSPNYHTDWWEKYVYLMSREPIAINSNYSIHDQIKWKPTKCQTARAAGITSLMLSFKSLIDSEELEPLLIRKTIPLCMWQYERMFATARIPMTDGDIIRHQPNSEHIVVFAKGHFYKVYVVDAHGKHLNVLDLQSLFDWILKDADSWKPENESELQIAALTGNDRTTWAKCRREHFTSGINRVSVQTIEEAIIFVVLDENEFSDMSERIKYLLHGSGSSMWFDKSITAIFFKDGKMGLNCEHSWGDAPAIGHLTEYFITYEYLYRIYDDEGNCKPYKSPEIDTMNMTRSKSVITPMRLYWEVNADLERVIKASYIFSVKNADDLELCLRKHDVFGKGFMKKAKSSPDAFIQLALQLAYYRDSCGSFALTYEASMTRLYLQGRTETVRSLTSEVKEFVLAMNDENVTAKEKINLMRIAANKHQMTYRDCMSGKGIDRHLFALYVVCKGQGYGSPFLKNTLTMPWTMSTSQVAQTQTETGLDTNIPEVRDSLSPGGGFGPASDKGYGVSYMTLDDNTICFNVSAKNSCEKTNAPRFMDNIFWALSEMKRVFDEMKES